MKINEFFASAEIPEMNFGKYLRRETNPPLDVEQISFNVSDKKGILSTPIAGDVALVLGYKGRPGALVSLAEEDNKEEWQIPQLQGVRSRKSFRLTKGFKWQKYFGDLIVECAKLPETTVRRITMPDIFAIEGIEEAKSQNVQESYHLIIKYLGM